MSDSLQSHGLQHASLPCPSPTLAACSDSHPLSQWCHSNEYLRLISFRIDWFDLLAVQGTLKNLLQYHSLKASVLQHSALLMVLFSHPYMTPWKTIVLTRWTFFSKVMSLLFNMLSRLVTAFLARSKRLLISWLQSLSAEILPTKIRSVNFYIVSPSVFHEVMGPDAMIFVF